MLASDSIPKMVTCKPYEVCLFVVLVHVNFFSMLMNGFLPLILCKDIRIIVEEEGVILNLFCILDTHFQIFNINFLLEKVIKEHFSK